jgi:NAD(P)-dependent dehydrogenase (short-subunit alcohol dehydrogenase family)
MRIAVAGARGQLGAAIVREFALQHDVIALAREDLDISDDRQVKAAMERLRPDAIINCAAYNDVDGAEDDPVRALNVNTFAVRALSCSMARHWRPTRKTIVPIRARRMPLRNSSGSGSPPTLRAGTSCASKACSAASRVRGRPEGVWPRS